MLAVHGLSKIYPTGKKALSAISLKFEASNWVSIVGESGCGKTSLLRCIAGLENYDEGSIYLDNEKLKQPFEQLVPGHEEINFVKQDLDLFPNHRVIEILDYQLRFFNEAYRKERIAFTTEYCQLEGMMSSYPRELSGGQQQRVAIAQALIDEPQLLLLDESFSHLDVCTKRELRSLLRRIVDDTGTALLFVTHDTQETLAYSDRIIVLKDGAVVQDNEPRTIYTRPSMPYVSTLFGITNFLSAALVKALKLDEAQKWAVRAQHCKIHVSDGFKGVVKEVRFMGAFNLIVVDTLNTVIEMFDWEQGVMLGQEIEIFIEVEQCFGFET